MKHLVVAAWLLISTSFTGNQIWAFSGMLNILNDTGEPWLYLYIIPESPDAESEDLLINHLIYPGEDLNIRYTGWKTSRCRVRAVDTNGRIYESKIIDTKWEDLRLTRSARLIP